MVEGGYCNRQPIEAPEINRDSPLSYRPLSEIFLTIGGGSGTSTRVAMAKTNGEMNGIQEGIPLRRVDGLLLVMDTPKGPPK